MGREPRGRGRAVPGTLWRVRVLGVLYVFIKKERKGVNFPQKKSQPSLVHALRLTRII